jgi:hypothetical protein
MSPKQSIKTVEHVVIVTNTEVVIKTIKIDLERKGSTVKVLNLYKSSTDMYVSCCRHHPICWQLVESAYCFYAGL